MAYFEHFATGIGTGLDDWITACTIEHEYRFLPQYLPKSQAAEILEIGPRRGELAALRFTFPRHFLIVDRKIAAQ